MIGASFVILFSLIKVCTLPIALKGVAFCASVMKLSIAGFSLVCEGSERVMGWSQVRGIFVWACFGVSCGGVDAVVVVVVVILLLLLFLLLSGALEVFDMAVLSFFCSEVP